MPSLTPVELSEARRRSGRLGGRPRKPTVSEARQVKLGELVPKALTVLEQALESEDERIQVVAAKEVLDRAWGKATAKLEVSQENPVSRLDPIEAAHLLEAVRELRAKKANAIVGAAAHEAGGEGA